MTMTKTLLKSAALAFAAVSMPALVTAPAAAQSKTGVATANYEAAVVQSAAYQNAVTQMKTTYKADIDATNARAQSAQAELTPLVNAYNTAAQKPGASAQTVQAEATALQNKRNAVQQELARLQQRVTLATAYVEEQVGAKLNDAIKSAMKASKVDLVIQPGAVVAREPYVDITPAIIAELNKMVPSASITPPAGWQPGQAEQAQQQAAPAPAQQPSGR